jgi:hypothetical protein
MINVEAFVAGVPGMSQSKIRLMRFPQWISRKNDSPLAAVYSVFRRRSCALLSYVMAAAIASAALPVAHAATGKSTGEGSSAATNGRHNALCGAADKFRQPALLQTCGASSGFALAPSRKQGPYNASTPASIAAWPYLIEDRERRLLSPLVSHRPGAIRDIYLRCCSLLI